jgi:hypothetical protein
MHCRPFRGTIVARRMTALAVIRSYALCCGAGNHLARIDGSSTIAFPRIVCTVVLISSTHVAWIVRITFPFSSMTWRAGLPAALPLGCHSRHEAC